ncbi:hypothetical protein ColLi_09450 [Colletotrichum liriopes]|uniref:Uncharacterized protein n=1 Tax=Colletotrichum liriopes TaxID=708192 RepID=A0AA37GU97_9PEZI|nr:hypothetical protein ColLi_09450 [Colletotrichum liriopes]
MDFNGATECMNNSFSLEEKEFAAEFAESKHLGKGDRALRSPGLCLDKAIKLSKKINDSN